MKQYIAIYTEREDEDWDLSTIFATEHHLFTEHISQASGANNVAEQLMHDMELAPEFVEVRMVEFNELRDIPEVLEGDSMEKVCTPYKKPHRPNDSR